MSRRIVRSVIAWVLPLCVALGRTLVCAGELPETHSGTLLLKPSRDSDPTDAPRVSTFIRAEVTGNVARVHLTQEFANPSTAWMEGVYVFPLATESEVEELLMRVGARTVRYAGGPRAPLPVRAAGGAACTQKQASLRDPSRTSLFTTSVANIAPQSSVTIEIAYVQAVTYCDTRYTLTLPLAIVPRATPAEELDAAALRDIEEARARNILFSTTAPPASLTSLEQHVSVEVELPADVRAASVQSLHHRVSIREDARGIGLTLQGDRVPADRDFELVWSARVPVARGR